MKLYTRSIRTSTQKHSVFLAPETQKHRGGGGGGGGVGGGGGGGIKNCDPGQDHYSVSGLG